MSAPAERSAAQAMPEANTESVQHNADRPSAPTAFTPSMPADSSESGPPSAPGQKIAAIKENPDARLQAASENQPQSSLPTASDPPPAAAPLKAATPKRKAAKIRPTGQTSRKPATVIGKKNGTDEIARLQSQAFSETSRDRVSGEKPRSNTPPSDYQVLPQPGAEKSAIATPAISAAKTGSVHSELAKCQRNASFFVREKCKWRLCDGQWGKNGCPSYETKSAAY